MAGIYRYYKERLIEISGRNRSLYSKNINKKYSYDIGKLFGNDYDEITGFIDFLWKDKKHSYTLISKHDKDRIYKNYKLEDKISKLYKDTAGQDNDTIRNENLRREKFKREEIKKTIQSQVTALKYLKREIEEFAKESGRYEMYIGYPFVQGSIGKEMVIKAPLILFPIKVNIIDESTVEIELKKDESVQLNKVFILAYAKYYKLNVEELVMEFDNLIDAKLKTIDDVVAYLRGFGFKITHNQRKGLFDFSMGTEPELGDNIETKNYAIIGRFPLANSIYNDYNILEKNHLTTDAIDELLESRFAKKIKKPNTKLYTINQLDYAQENAIEEINKFGNMVIYGPPGTGKSQTIVNIITDALSKNKRVLVVSQKKAALDVVFNRLGVLNNKAMYINDTEKNKVEFYERTKNAHTELVSFTETKYENDYKDIELNIEKEMAHLKTISDTLFVPTGFGLTLQEMYASSHIIGKTSNEYFIYKQMQNYPNLMRLNYAQLSNTIRIIKEKKKVDLFYKHIELKQVNPLIDHIKPDLDIHAINTARTFLSRLIGKRRLAPYDMSKYPNSRQLLSFYLENGLNESEDLKPIVKAIARLENPKLNNALKISYVIFPIYPFFRYKMRQKEKLIESNFEKTLKEVKTFVSDYAVIESVLEKKGYAITIDNILNGNTLFLKLLLEALNNYVEIREININLKSLTAEERLILNFAYENSKNLKTCKQVIDALLSVRIYHELIFAEAKNKQQLSLLMEYNNIKNRIISLKEEQNQVVRNICIERFKKDYLDLYNSDAENKNFLYQISKQQNLWPLRTLMDNYSELMFALFPCWLLSPESVSTIMPLKKELFDLIIFDEASQVFIESTLPTIYRGKHIVIAGDNKQLRPSANFVRRYMGNDNEDFDLSTQAALEVESLLDLATSRYNSTNLTYHYRSKNEELINFSNYAFYDCKLEIAPNIAKNIGTKPIERIKINGTWIDRHNHEEAVKVVYIIKKIFKTRRHKETIGVITFNTEQEEYIEDLLDKECEKNPWFKNAYLKEQNRKENGEDVSIFIKNLENVQGDERDIIIFSIGYAHNEWGKVTSHFGPLNLEGGENRLNVAITRAKQKIYVITSIEPEELVVEGSKNAGPKIFKKYLQYARAISKGQNKEAYYILQNFKLQNTIPAKIEGFEGEMKDALEKLGYIVELNLGNNAYKLTLAIYDRALDRYLVGVECDYSAFASSSSIVERDIFRSKFMESRGWKIIRVWSRDWWQNKSKVIAQIAKSAEKTRERLDGSGAKTVQMHKSQPKQKTASKVKQLQKPINNSKK